MIESYAIPNWEHGDIGGGLKGGGEKQGEEQRKM